MSSEQPCKGDKVECMHPHDPACKWVVCTVEAPLAVQFTVIDSEGSTFFFFYSDREKYSGQQGATWRPVKAKG